MGFNFSCWYARSLSRVSDYESIRSFYGRINPSYGVIASLYGLVNSFYDPIESFYGLVGSPYGLIKSLYDVMESSYGLIKSSYDAIALFYGVIASSYEPIDSISGHRERRYCLNVKLCYLLGNTPEVVFGLYHVWVRNYLLLPTKINHFGKMSNSSKEQLHIYFFS